MNGVEALITQAWQGAQDGLSLGTNHPRSHRAPGTRSVACHANMLRQGEDEGHSR